MVEQRQLDRLAGNIILCCNSRRRSSSQFHIEAVADNTVAKRGVYTESLVFNIRLRAVRPLADRSQHHIRI